MQRNAPVHPSKLVGEARKLYVARSRQSSKLTKLHDAVVGAAFRLAIDYGEAQSLLVRGGAPRRGAHFPARVEIVFRLERLEIYGRDRKLFGTARWQSFVVPAEIRLTRDDKQRAIVIGDPDEPGGLCENWFVGCVGDILTARDRIDTI
jgi:hypothetical protein